jgi:hypothetical protein
MSVSSTTKFSPSPRALSISKNIGTSSAYTIVVITTYEDGIAITVEFSYIFSQYIYDIFE